MNDQTDDSAPVTSPSFEAPHPGSTMMPRWSTAQLNDAPDFKARMWFALLGPGLVMGASAIGGGEWLVGPAVTAKYGGQLMWLATLSIIFQGLYNVEVSRYTLYTGEPIFTGKFRTMPGPFFWVSVYLVLDLGSIFPYLAANAATPIVVVLLDGTMPEPETVPYHWWLMKGIAAVIFLAAMIPLIFGRKIYSSIKVVMSFKLVVVVAFLSFLAVFYSHTSTWSEILSGFVKFGNVPVLAGEDRNGNGRLDAGEDWDGDTNLDVVERVLVADANGKPVEFDDVDGDGYHDGTNVENIFVSLFLKGEFPDIDLRMIALISALASIAGNGGLTNTAISNFTRDQGWGMGHHVGAIPSIIGGRGIKLSHVGSVFKVDDNNLVRWRRWYRHVLRDQFVIWVPACFVGVALPSMLSIEFLRRGTEASRWTAAGMTAEGVGSRVDNPPDEVLASMTGLSDVVSGSMWGNVFWALTLFCGFLVLAPSMCTTIDGIIRRWLDAFWTASAKLRSMDTSYIRILYFRALVIYAVFGMTMLWINQPTGLIEMATLGYNFALGFSCFHALVINTVLLPRQLRPNWLIRTGLVLSGSYFLMLGAITAYRKVQVNGWIPILIFLAIAATSITIGTVLTVSRRHQTA